MEWYYALNGQQHGPVNETEFQRLISTGVIRPDTLVWRNGLPEWQPCAKVQFAGAPPVAGAPGVVCAQCGGTFPPDQVMSFGAASVCATCKPVYVQRLREGVITPVITGDRTGRRPVPVDPDELIREIKARDFTLDIASCITRAWELLKAKLWLVVLTTFLVTLIMQAAGSVPIVGFVVAMILNGPFIAGLYAFYLKLARGEPASVGDGFSGFSKLFVQSMLGLIVMSLAIYIWFAPGVIYAIRSGLFDAMRTGQYNPKLLDATTILLFAGAILPVIYFSVCWTFTMLLIVDMEMNFWNAIKVSHRVVHMHWWSIFALLAVSGILSMLGCFACCIGIFFTLPLLYASMVYCYEDIFGVKSNNQH